MDLAPIISHQARLFSLVNNSITFLQRSTLTLQRTDTQRALLTIGSIYYFLTPTTVLWYDDPLDDENQCLTYYFKLKESEDLMIKVLNNKSELHEKILAVKCQLRQRKVFFKQYNSEFSNNSALYSRLQTISNVVNSGGALVGSGLSKGAEYCAGGLEKLGQFVASNLNEGKTKVELPTVKEVSGKLKSFSQYSLGLASSLIGKFFTKPSATVNDHIIPHQQSHPLMKAAKNTLGGGINLLMGISDGINHLEVGVVKGAGQIIEKKYGEDLKQILQNVVLTGNNCEDIIKQPIRQIGRNLNNTSQEVSI